MQLLDIYLLTYYFHYSFLATIC